MGNLASLLKHEISRVARKELRAETEALKKASSRHRSDIAELKRTVAALEKQYLRQVQALSRNASAQPPSREEKAVRFSATRLKMMREKKGLSAAVMGRLLRVTAQTIYNWEAGASRPNKEQILAIATVRSTGKRELRARLEAF